MVKKHYLFAIDTDQWMKRLDSIIPLLQDSEEREFYCYSDTYNKEELLVSFFVWSRVSYRMFYNNFVHKWEKDRYVIYALNKRIYI